MLIRDICEAIVELKQLHRQSGIRSLEHPFGKANSVAASHF
jgi:hypothetical protein